MISKSLASRVLRKAEIALSRIWESLNLVICTNKRHLQGLAKRKFSMLLNQSRLWVHAAQTMYGKHAIQARLGRLLCMFLMFFLLNERTGIQGIIANVFMELQPLNPSHRSLTSHIGIKVAAHVLKGLSVL